MIRDGSLVGETGIIQADIAVQNGKIQAVAERLEGEEVISARGLWVIPGGVDPHVHLEMQAGDLRTSDTWAEGSQAAAWGGTLTVIDFVEPFFPGQALDESLRGRMKQAAGHSAVDFSFHMTLCAADDAHLAQVPGIVSQGVTSFKLYTTYEGFKLSSTDLLRALATIRENGAVALVHAESDEIVDDASRRLLAHGKSGLAHFTASRPVEAEVEAVERVLSLAGYTGAPVYIVHLSTRGGVLAVARARAGGQAAWGETCPQYLLLDETLIATQDWTGSKFVCCPPLRTSAHRDALWAALAGRAVQTIGSDHCAFNYQGQKKRGTGSFQDVPPGLPGVELRLSLMYTFGVAAGRIAPTDWVAACCANPARIFGLYPRKGTLLPGADADLVLFDPGVKRTVAHRSLHEQVDYTPYEGLLLQGEVKSCLLRGQMLIRDGEWVGPPAAGEFLRCSSYRAG